MLTSKLTSKAQTTVPRPGRAALNPRPGDELEYRLEAGRVILTKRADDPVDNPFRTFDEWDSDADADAYADLTELVPNRGGFRVPSFLATDVDVRAQAGIRKRSTFSRAALGTCDERISTLVGPSS